VAKLMNGIWIRVTWPAWYWATALSFLAFVLVTWGVLAAGPHSFDLACAEHFQEHAQAHPWARNIFWFITQLGSPPVLGTLAGLAIGTLVLLKKRLLAAVWLFAVAGGALLNYGMKGQFERGRPPPSLRDAAVARLTSLSYPSGHAMGSTIGLGMCIYLVLRRVHRQPWRTLGATALALLIALIGFSRVYLRAHWFSDVVGGIAIGSAWVLFWLGVYRWRREAVPVPLPEEIEEEAEEEV
jgi:undecaprenyl-diphosphatase